MIMRLIISPEMKKIWEEVEPYRDRTLVENDGFKPGTPERIKILWRKFSDYYDEKKKEYYALMF